MEPLIHRPLAAASTSRRASFSIPRTPKVFAALATLVAATFLLVCFCSLRYQSSRPRNRTANPSIRASGGKCDSSGTTFIYGRCPDKCHEFSKKEFEACDALAKYGCGSKDCGGGKYSCSFFPEVVEYITRCPGDKLVFDGISVDDLSKVSYYVDLSVGASATDIYILPDATYSMEPYLDAVKRQANALFAAFNSSDVAFGVGMYRDERSLESGFRNIQGVTKDLDSVRRGLKSLEAYGGLDRNEANLVAMFKAATYQSIGWRKNSRRILVTFGDQAGHEPTCPGNLALTRKNVVDALKEASISVVSVGVGRSVRVGLDAAPASFKCYGIAPPGQASYITQNTNGGILRSMGPETLVSEIEMLIKSLPKTFDVIDTCKPQIDSVHTPGLPTTLGPDESQTIMNTMSVKPSACKAGKFECSYTYTETGAHIPSVDVGLVNVKGC